MNYYIITGTSSGIGEAIARELILERHCVFCISRNLNETLTEMASSVQSQLWHLEADLGETSHIPELMNEIFSSIDPGNISSIALINNAGVLDPVAAAGNYNSMDITQHLLVNLLAPMLLTNEFIRHTAHFKVPKTIVNISSGAASTPYAGRGPYCSSKAGLEMFTRTTALEQKQNPHPVRLLSIAPGIVDTKMQIGIRNSDVLDFPMKERFEKLHQNNLLSLPGDVAEKIISLIFGELPGGSEIIDLRKL